MTYRHNCLFVVRFR